MELVGSTTVNHDFNHLNSHLQVYRQTVQHQQQQTKRRRWPLPCRERLTSTCSSDTWSWTLLKIPMHPDEHQEMGGHRLLPQGSEYDLATIVYP